MFTAVLYAFLFTLFIATASTLLHPTRTESASTADEAGERLATAEDILAACMDFDRMLVSKGLLTGEHVKVIRLGTKSHAVVTGMRPTGTAREDHREVELDVMVKRPEGGQFPAHERALIPASSLTKVLPGSVIDTYYRTDDESAVVVCVPPG
ncbi:hypothetical protein [Mycobacterium deserti]|uniref:Uncharacterized protein n=1 Tax=Mycobacterium deserti TaxID=2978347 RepID=A0ABT2MCG3_9MYCO|nr:hypothetical protein [Mycobacterium deserti]MCT7659957.1 hypothetical protein [Mycobacterium deserti]